ncbi:MULTISPECIES: hypothetical protein [Wolbachia]|uniref:hypothetical protein n=1 Tax=Wolbachia TaxID=953 RepID=UPI001CF54B6E|nr:hypothetical protein [Wolbachia endosymbiont of Tribolium confusum]MCA7010869.1 hypothetical protein [Wolbachia endosymbiont of Tribolium confusum]
MTTKKTVSFDDMDGNTYELIIDSKKLPKGLYSAIEGIRRTGKKTQQSVFVDETDNKPKIFDDKSRWPIFEKPEGVPSPSDVSEKSINLGEGRGIYNKKSSNRQNPFIPSLSKIEPSASENAELRWFKSRVVEAKSVEELNKTIDQALSSGIRINAYSEGQKSFANEVISKMPLIKCKENEKEDVICELMLNGAIFSYDLLQDKGISEMHNKLYQEIRPQIDEWLKELRETGESAIENEGIIEDVEIDNQTFFMKFSENSKVNIARVLEGTKNLGLTTGEVKLGGDVIEIGNSKVEVKSGKEGERNYVDVSDNSAFEVAFPTSIGSLKIVICHNARNDRQVEIRVADKEMWSELQKKGETIGKGCFFGGMTVTEAVEKGSFPRDGKWSKDKVEKAISNSETLSWVDKVCGGSKETSRKL